MSTILNQPVTKKSVGFAALIAMGLALLGGGAYWIWHQAAPHPPTTAETRRQIWNFLRKESHCEDFQVKADWASLTNFTRPEKSGLAGTSDPPLKTKRSKLDKALQIQPVKVKKLLAVQKGSSTYFREKQQEATSYEGIYRLIGEELWAAEQLFANTNPATQQTGIVLASEAARYALQDAENGWLAARVCEGYLWPSLDLLAEQPVVTPDQLLQMCDAAFRANDETASLVRNYEYMIRRSPKRADEARFRLAMLYEQMGEFQKALRTLQEIKEPLSDKIRARINTLKARIQGQAAK